MTERAGRRRRRRRVAMTGAIVVLAAVAAALSLLWLRSARETRRAEARKLVALGRLELERRTRGSPGACPGEPRAGGLGRGPLPGHSQSLWAGPPMFLMTDRVQCARPAFGPDGGSRAAATTPR